MAMKAKAVMMELAAKLYVDDATELLEVVEEVEGDGEVVDVVEAVVEIVAGNAELAVVEVEDGEVVDWCDDVEVVADVVDEIGTPVTVVALAPHSG
jgi:hypothetical protein